MDAGKGFAALGPPHREIWRALPPVGALRRLIFFAGGRRLTD